VTGIYTALCEKILSFFTHVGRLGNLMAQTFMAIPDYRTYGRLTFEQMLKIGNGSLPIILFTGVLTGMVTSVQTAYQIKGFLPLYLVGTTVGKTVLLELGPVLTALVLSGRIGASIAAEIGTMKVTEQIDAVESLGFNSISFLVVPRVIAGVIMVPVVTVFADVIGILGGWWTAVAEVHLTSAEFLKGLRETFVLWDLTYGLIKSLTFGLVITTVGCYEGFNTKGGAEGVGRSTTRAVVISCMLILLLDYLLASLLL
jgi:phospholipid/cholesterol/gamma-HCH transport system permease protein